MRKALVGASLLNAAATLGHATVGTVYTLLPALRSSLDPDPKATLIAVWVLSSMLMITTTYVLIQAAYRNSVYHAGTLRFIGVSYLFSGLVFAFLALPQWAVLIPVGVLTFWGEKTHMEQDAV